MTSWPAKSAGRRGGTARIARQHEAGKLTARETGKAV